MRNLQSALKAFRSRKRFQAEGIIRDETKLIHNARSVRKLVSPFCLKHLFKQYMIKISLETERGDERYVKLAKS